MSLTLKQRSANVGRGSFFGCDSVRGRRTAGLGTMHLRCATRLQDGPSSAVRHQGSPAFYSCSHHLDCVCVSTVRFQVVFGRRRETDLLLVVIYAFFDSLPPPAHGLFFLSLPSSLCHQDAHCNIPTRQASCKLQAASLGPSIHDITALLHLPIVPLLLFAEFPIAPAPAAHTTKICPPQRHKQRRARCGDRRST